MGALNVLRACIDAGVGRVLVAGSADVYGASAPRRPPADRGVPDPARHAVRREQGRRRLLALQAYLGDGLGTLRVPRRSTTPAPDRARSMLVPGLAQRIADAERAAGSKVKVGRLDVVRDLSDVRDVVRAYRLLVELGTPGEAYNVCSGRGVTVRDVADRCSR